MGLKIGIIVGHSILKNGSCTSAGGYVQEYTYCKELAPLVADYLRKEGNTVDVIVCPERQFTEAYQEKAYKLGKINDKGYDLVVELHLNAFNGSAKGTEVLYYSEKGRVVAQRVNDKLDDIFVDRNIKKRDNLYILKDTDCTAILVESFFCDNKEDYAKADELVEKKAIAKKIAEGILNKDIVEVKPITPKPPIKPIEKNEVYYRVVVGSNQDIKESERLRDELKAKGYKETFIVEYIKEK